tara:strand:+ start:6582 stop:6761 length:180 start_codon:yes stop_codon:yes gene_type:complete
VGDVDKLASLKAKAALDAGESVEDVSLAIFEELFRATGMDPSLRLWCAERASEIMRGLK